MNTQPLWISILSTLLGCWLLYHGIRVRLIKRYNGWRDIVLGVCVVLAGLFLICHGNLYPPLSAALEPFLAAVWNLLGVLFSGFQNFWARVGSFDVEDLSR